jgi:hypothetical protein
MNSVMIFVKRNGLLVACPSQRTQDGAEWYCPHCESIVIRASFGVMNGTLICRCGSQVELVVDGVPVDPEKLNVLPGSPPQYSSHVDSERVIRRRTRSKLRPFEYFRVPEAEPLPEGFEEAPEAHDNGRIRPQFYGCGRLENEQRRTKRRKKLTDEDFLRECGIATEGEKENA